MIKIEMFTNEMTTGKETRAPRIGSYSHKMSSQMFT